MAELTLNIKLNPEIDGPKLAKIFSDIKNSFGDGVEIPGIDKIADSFKTASKSSEGLNKNVIELETATGKVNEKATMLQKLFTFNQISQGIQNVAGSLQDLSAPFVQLDTATQSMKTLGAEAEAMAPQLRDAALAMSNDLPIGAGAIQTAFTDAIASGVKGGVTELKSFVETAGKLAVGGGSSLEAVNKGLGATLNAFGASALEAGKYADTYFNIVNFGVTSIEELNTQLAGVTPTAAAMGISFDKVGGSLALMTQKGVPTAGAVTKLNSLFVEFAKPSAGVVAALEATGTSMSDFQNMLKNDDLVGAMELVQTGFTKLGKSATQSFSSSEAGAAFNVLMGDADLFKQTISDVANTTGSTENAYAKMADTIAVKTEAMKAKFDTFIVNVIDATGPLGTFATTASGIFANLAPQLTALAGLKTIIPDSAIDGLDKAKGSIVNLLFSVEKINTVKKFDNLSQSFKEVTDLTKTTDISLNGLKTKIASSFTGVSNAVSNSFDSIKKSSQKVITSAAGNYSKIVDELPNQLTKLNKFSLDKLGDFNTSMKQAGKNSVNAIGNSLTESAKGIKNINFGDIFASLKAGAVQSAGTIKTFVQSGISGFGTVASAVKNMSVSMVKNMAGFAMGMISSVIPAFATTTTAATTAGTATATAWGAALGPITLVIAGVAAIGGAFYLLYQNVEGFRDFIDSAWTVITDGAVIAWEVIKEGAELIIPIGELIFNAITFPFQLAWSIMSAVGEVVGDLISDFFGMSESVSTSASTLEFLQSVANVIIGGFQNMKAAIIGFSDAISSVINGVGNIAKKLLSGDFTGAIDEYQNIGNNMGKAFNKGFDESMEQSNFDNAKKKIESSLGEGIKINASIEVAGDLQTLVVDYQQTQAKITAIKNEAEKTGFISTEDRKTLEDLELKAGETANKIIAIAPEAKGTFKNIVDDAGNIKQVFDVNIAKAVELTNTYNNSQKFDKSKNQFSNSLIEQAKIVDDQKVRLAQLKIEIEKTDVNDTKAIEEKKKKYDELSEQYSKNKDILVDAYTKGADAGMLTENAITAIAKAQGITEEQAKKNLMGEMLKKAAADGKVTELEIQKIAKTFGVTKEVVTAMLNEQKKQTEEAQKTADAAKGIGEVYDENRKKIQESYDKDLKNWEALKAKKDAGTISDKELVTYNELNKSLKNSTAQLREYNRVQFQGSKEFDTSYKEKEKKQISLIEQYKNQYNEIDRNLKAEQSALKLSQDGVLTKEQELGFENKNLAILNDKLKTLKNILVEKKLALINEDGTFTLKPKLKEVDKKQAEEVINEAISVMDGQANIKAKLSKVELDPTKAAESLKKAQDELLKAQTETLKLNFEIGLITSDEYYNQLRTITQNELNKLQTDIDNINNQLLNNTDLAGKQLTDLQIAELNVQKQNLINSKITTNNELLGIERSQYEENERLRISNITLLADREYQMTMFESRKLYQTKLAEAKGNQDLELQAYQEFINAKILADANYARQNLSLSQQISKRISENLLLAISDFDPSINLDADKEETNKKKENLSQQEKDLRESYKNQLIDRKDYYSKLSDLEEERANIEVENAKNPAWVEAMNQSLSQAFEKLTVETKKNLDILVKAEVASKDLIGKYDKEWNEKIANSQRLLMEGKVEESKKEADEASKIMSLKLSEEQKSADATKQMYMDVALVGAASFAQMIVDGRSTSDAFLMMLVDMADAMVPMIVAWITGVQLASPNPANAMTFGAAGLASALALTAIFKGLIAAGKASINGYKTGGLVDGGRQYIEINEEGQEFVMNAKATSKGKSDLDKMNKLNLSPREFAMKFVMPDIAKELANNFQSNIKLDNRTLEAVKIIQEKENNLINQKNMDIVEKNKKFIDTSYFIDSSKMENKLNTLIDKVEMNTIEIKKLQKNMNYKAQFEVEMVSDDRELIERSYKLKQKELRRF